MVGIFTLSSFNVEDSEVKTADVELQTWYYKCTGSGKEGTFLMRRGATKAEARSIAINFC